jgi:hypothetical protein
MRHGQRDTVLESAEEINTEKLNPDLEDHHGLQNDVCKDTQLPDRR